MGKVGPWSNASAPRGRFATRNTYFHAYHRSEHDSGVALETALGRYVDKFEKRGAEWRIIDRVVVMEHVQLEKDVQQPYFTVDNFVRGTRGEPPAGH